MRLGFIKNCSASLWQKAPHLVLEDAKTIYRKTIDLQTVRAATKIEQWPMQISKALLSDFKGSIQLAFLGFCSSYWNCPLDLRSYEAYDIIASQGTFVSTRSVYGLKHALAHFLSAIALFLNKIKHAIYVWIDHFTIYAKTDPQLLDYCKNVFKIFSTHNLALSAKKSALYTREVR